MPATNLNHVSVRARDLDASVGFYRDLFGMEPIPTPNFGFPVRWLRVGDLQLHLFTRKSEPGRFHHLALTVDDFADVYRRAAQLGVLDDDTFGHHLYELPGDVAQLYVRDPAGNLIEVDAPHASELPEDVRAEMRRLADVYPQDDDNRRATLFLAGS